MYSKLLYKMGHYFLDIQYNQRELSEKGREREKEGKKSRVIRLFRVLPIVGIQGVPILIPKPWQGSMKAERGKSERGRESERERKEEISASLSQSIIDILRVAIFSCVILIISN